MRMHLAELSRQTKLHPLSLLPYLAQLGQFAELWPTIDVEWLGTLKSLHPEVFGDVSHAESAEIDGPGAALRSKLAVGGNAALVLEKLFRGRRWGSAYTSREQIQKHTHLPPVQLFSAIQELMDAGCLIEHERGGPYSLDSAAKLDIELIVNERLRKGN